MHPATLSLVLAGLLAATAARAYVQDRSPKKYPVQRRWGLCSKLGHVPRRVVGHDTLAT